MRVTVFSPRDPLPVDIGLAERVYQLCRYLGTRHEVEVVFPATNALSTDGRVPDDQPFTRLQLDSHVAAALDRRLPDSSALRGPYHLHPWFYRPIRNYLRSRRPDAVLVEFPYLMPVVRAASRGLDPLTVLSEHNVEYSQARRLGIRLWPLLARYERFACNLADAVVTVSETDRETLAPHLDPDVDLVVAPNGVSVDRYTPDAEGAARVRRDHDLSFPVLVYHGNLADERNARAVDNLLTDVFPAVRREFEDATLLLLGSNPPETDQPGVICPGFVDDLPGYLAAADVAAVPMTAGGGTKLKVLEYLATGTPVIATPVAAEGIPLEHERTALLVDDVADVADETLRLLRDADLRERLRTGGRDLVVSEFSWTRTLAPYDDLLATVDQDGYSDT
jgi:glycosyltransferase involved in cell wall biosynthesis